MTKQEFLQQATAAALATSQTSGLPPGITIAQAILESNWGESQLARDAHNYFGIKAHGEHGRVAYPTFEVVNGRTVRVTTEFARYTSMEECFVDRDRIILRVACYADALAAKHEPDQFARALARHWATDPRYADKLLSLYRSQGLYNLDKKISAEDAERQRI
jgi:flagellum-specific peptidoglycan hydrolase FlgJ